MTRNGIVFLLLLAALVWSWSNFAQHPSSKAQQPHPVTSQSSLPSRQSANLQAAEAIAGGPTISASFADRVLAAAHSPATGIGATLYQLSSKYHIDNSVALAFFKHESSFGTRGMAALTKSWGNIRCTSGWECDPSGGYRAYSSWADGLNDVG